MANVINAKAYHLLRRDTLKNWQEENPLLKAGEICLVTDAEDSSKLIKICLKDDTRWSEVDYFSPAQIDIPEIDVSGKMDKFGEVFFLANEKDPSKIDKTYLGIDSPELILSQIIEESGEDTSVILKGVSTPSNASNDAVANKGYVDTAIGNIDTALDSIIAIQNSILGGGA